MKKIWNTINTMLLATKYSFSFCWRNARAETAVRLIALLVITAINYLNVQLTGKLGDAVQHSVGKIQSGTTFFHLLRDTDIGKLIILMTFLAIVSVLSGKFAWYFTSKWNKRLGFANKREVNESTAKLDVASFKGKGRDNLYRKIQELPFGIQTRISFSNELFGLLSTSVSFVLFGTALVWHNPLYAVILIIVSVPMMISEFSLVTLWWRLFEAVVPINKRRHVLERPYNNDTIFAQAKMLGQMGALRTLIDENTAEITSEYDQLRKQTLKWELVTHLLGNIGLTCIIIHAVWTTIITVVVLEHLQPYSLLQKPSKETWKVLFQQWPNNGTMRRE